jgi:hypothetical protein
MASQYLNSLAARLKELELHALPAERKISEREVL